MRFFLVLSLATIAASCSYANSAGPACAGACPNQIRVLNNRFQPATRDIQIDETVTFLWNSNGTTHNVTFNDGQTSGNMSEGQYERTFSVPGTYPYQCTIHGASMSGSIQVN